MKKFLLLITMIIITLFVTSCTLQEVVKDNVRVSFSTNIDLDIEDIVMEKNSILKLSDLPNQVIDDMIFEGWFFDIDYSINYFEIEIIEDITLYGLYENYSSRQETIALDSIKLPTSTYQNINLPLKVSGFNVVWESSNSSALSNDGIYTNVDSITEITLLATISTDGIVFNKEFEIDILPYPYEIEAKAISDTFTFDELVTSDLVLKTSFDNGFVGAWKSSDESVITNDGKINRTDTNKLITLELTLEKDDYVAKYNYEVTVKAYEVTVNDPKYFINSLEDSEINTSNVIMSQSEINDYNQVVLNSSGANVVNLENLDTQVSKLYVSNLISNYSNIDRYRIYNNGKIISYTDKQAILNNRNLNNLQDTINVRYAVSTTHTNIRTYPTEFYSNNAAVDRFQETGFSAGVPMIVYHTSLDSNWYYVRMYHYDGWVKASDVALSSREEALRYNKTGNFVVVTNNIITINDQIIRMGYTIPYASKTSETFELEFPTRKSDGTLEIKNISYPNDGSVSDGYIEYTYKNLLTQAYKLVGMQYSWGDKITDGLDCSSTQAAIYNCFGFILGRNTSNQWKTNTYGSSISGLTNDSLKNFQVGTLLYTSSHVLMYIGVDADGNCWLLHNTTSGNICKIQTLNSYGTVGINNILTFHN